MKTQYLMAMVLLFAGWCYGVPAVEADSEVEALPKGFVYLADHVPSIVIDLRYYTENNFLGCRVDGYVNPRCIITRDAAESLKGVQEELKPFGLGLKVFDAYRPQRAVNHFVRWAKDLGDTAKKQGYYPRVKKENLFKDGYIASRSGHTRGSTVDLTIISLETSDQGHELDMGSPFDFFGPESWPDNPRMSSSQRAHRLLLRMFMEKHGFKPYAKEWWHFTLKKEPFPDTYFDFPIR